MENFEARLGRGCFLDLAGDELPGYRRIGDERTANSDEVEFLSLQGFHHPTHRSEAACDHDRHASDGADTGSELDEISFAFDGALRQFVFAFVLDRDAHDL